MTLHQAPTQDAVSPTTIMGTVKLDIDMFTMTILKAIIVAMQDRQGAQTTMNWVTIKATTIEMLLPQVMKKIQVLVIMKNTHMRGTIAMPNHITAIVNQ